MRFLFPARSSTRQADTSRLAATIAPSDGVRDKGADEPASVQTPSQPQTIRPSSAVPVSPLLKGRAYKQATARKEPPNKRSLSILAAGSALILSSLLGMVIFQNLASYGDSHAQKGYYRGKTTEEIQADLNEQVDWYAMEISIKPTLTLAAGQTQVEARIENAQANHVDQKVTLALKDDPDDIIFSSGAIAPGEYLETITLSHSFEPGTYQVIATFQGYNQDISLGGDGQLLGHEKFGASCAAEITLICT